MELMELEMELEMELMEMEMLELEIELVELEMELMELEMELMEMEMEELEMEILNWLASVRWCKSLYYSCDGIQSNGMVHFEDRASEKRAPLCDPAPCFAFV